ncbi:MAG: prolyl oligopeptidase family serine peptidase [Bacteroidetes bacterium]|nr:prolyl oligopeptidase family serine peptidase [Bacteroidota bacterium]MBT4398848.1 prolyl oligopeptidase family serine peptidase [Bacteroidota bacterium]
MQNKLSIFLPLIIAFSGVLPTNAQGKLEDYKRADSMRKEYSNKSYFDRVRSHWLDSSNQCWYTVNTPKGMEYYLLDAEKAEKKAAFDAQKLAKSLSGLLDKDVDPFDLPINELGFSDDRRSISFLINRSRYEVDLKKYKLQKLEDLPERSSSGRYWGQDRDELENKPVVAPDSTKEAFIRDYDVWIRDKKSREEFRMSWDGSEGEYYSSYMYWSPDSKKLIANKYTPGYKRLVQYIESSPDDQLQPKHSERQYTKPGDKLAHIKPTLFLPDEKKQIYISDDLYPHQFSLNRFKWRDDSRAITFEYNQRGHQLYRVLEIDASAGEPKVLIEEACETFFHYSGKKYRYDMADGAEILWTSERDGWNHLYLYDGKSGKIKNQITKGKWLVRKVHFVDEEKGFILFEASGKEEGDPYLVHLYRINIDGSGLTHLTPAEGNHSVSFSSDKSYFIDTWSMVDQAPKTVLRRTSDGEMVLPLEETDISKLLETGWKPPEVFTAKGRDGETDIWGIIVRPSNFNPEKSYPIIEYIYAGPHSSFVPKSFRAYQGMQAVAELGFILVQCDGMGTSNRSKAFHDVCWQNLGDAGFPDRIKWITAAAEKYPYMDISKVGIYGTSAGGQSSTGGVLFHPEFYDVAVSSCGCHDNRMDKIWWNEQWMGYPIGPHYAKASNVDNAYRLKGKLFLIVGEMDSNVDPSSTMQVVDALIKANKDFDLLVVPGMGHSGGGKLGERKRRDFFVRHLLGTDPPDWNNLSE